jgi:DUF4097 and DUF4098 domain-containing protein YvlB
MRGMILLGLFGVALVFFAGCTSPPLPGAGMVQEEFHGVYTLPPETTLQVSNLNGNIAISGSPDQTLVVNAVKSSQYGQAELDKVTIEVQNSSTAMVATRVGTPGARVTVRYEILVPGTVLVEKVDTTNGNIDASGITGDGVVGTTNGNLDLSDWAGTLSAGSTNGNIVVHGIGNISSLHTTNGQISGTIGYVTGDPASISTSNGAVTLEMDRDLSSPLSVTSSNSPVTVTIPKIFNANVDLSTTNGQILLKGVTLTGGSGAGSQQAGILGSGGPQLKVTTTNGNIILKAA